MAIFRYPTFFSSDAQFLITQVGTHKVLKCMSTKGVEKLRKPYLMVPKRLCGRVWNKLGEDKIKTLKTEKML